ncbi:MAG: acyl-CoA synthetase [Ilumatobacteraceae bacterium]|nr:acyl-CoA synthetase [Ilumatobacteraceae bacterium]
MYPGVHARDRANQACIVMAATGEVITYADFEERTNRLAHLLRDRGLRYGDHYSILMENNSRYLETCGAGERSGLCYTPINSHLTADEVAYILQNSESRALITSAALRDVAVDAMAQSPDVTLGLIVDPSGPDAQLQDYVEAVSAFPSTPIADEALGTPMLYSSGTTGRPKGIFRQMPDRALADGTALSAFLVDQWHYRPGMVYLSPAPLYHSAPQGATGNTIRMGGTVVVMERFDPEQLLALVERHRVTHIQMVPTMFSRLLKLPEEVRNRYDLSSLEFIVHAAAPCPVPVKEQMIAWWGPIINEYYAATEGIGYTACDSVEWLAHKGTVGRVRLGELHILDDDFRECPRGRPGTIYFKPPAPLQYWKDPQKSKDASTPDGVMSTVGDMGYVDEDGWLFLTDRKTFMIISGGVNIYPQETENLLITHPKVADAAVFGVPNADLGEEVKAVIQPMPGVEPGPELASELIAFCRQHLSTQKCPKSVDFEEQLPRLPTGKLYKRVLRDRYWADRETRIV